MNSVQNCSGETVNTAFEAQRANDILGIGCLIFEMGTGEIVNEWNSNFKTFLAMIRKENFEASDFKKDNKSWSKFS